MRPKHSRLRTINKKGKLNYSDKFKGDKIILKSLLDNASYEGESYGYVSCMYQAELIAEKGNLTGNNKAFEIANKILEAVQETIIKMHQFAMEEIKK